MFSEEIIFVKLQSVQRFPNQSAIPLGQNLLGEIFKDKKIKLPLQPV